MRVGVDVGGSHVGLGIVDENGKIILKKSKDYEEHKKDMSDVVLNTIKELLRDILSKSKIDISKIESIGIAIPGTVSETSIVKAENLGIRDFEIEKELRKEFDVPVRLQNDAKCAAIAEKEFGSLKGYDDSMFLILGTGVGGAVFLNGKLLRPKRYSGFEVGHMVIKDNGIKCGCGRKGCYEVYSSIKRFKEKIRDEFNLPDIDGIRIENFMRENEGNEKLNEMIDTYIDDVCIGLINLIDIFEPEAVSLGGSFAFYKDMFLEKLEKKIVEKNELYNTDSIPKFVVADLKNDAGIIGAAMI